MEIYRVKEPFVFTIFGASGDLAKLKIFPALFALAEQKRFPKDFWIMGYARTKKTDTTFRSDFKKSVQSKYGKNWTKFQENILNELLERVFYFSGQYDRAEDFERYQAFLEKQTGSKKVMHVVYFSVPSSVFKSVVKGLASMRKSKSDDIRLILEKPFGDDEHSAQKLFRCIGKYFSEEHVYLLDHYLGKKAVRSLIPLRHMNRILNLMLKGKEVANIQISALETVGVKERIGYFDQVGTLKDMIQSHLFQLLALSTMSIPIGRTAENIQKEKAAILSALKFVPEKKHITLGQYAGYRQENELTKNSNTPTYVALKLFIDRESWYGVPIFLRTGKKLHEKHAYITFELKKFEFKDKDQEPNRVIIELYPDEKIHIRLLDEDGITSRAGEIGVSKSIACQGDYCLPPHGLLLLDVIRGEKIHFLSFAEILASWKLIDKISEFTEKEKIPVEKYKAGSCGPKSYQNLMKGTGFRWYDLHEDKCRE